MTVLAALIPALLGINVLASADQPAAQPEPATAVTAVLGAKVNVAPRHFATAYARCPRGYFVTGGGAYGGAVTEIVSSPMHSLGGWFIDGYNAARGTHAFQERAVAVCLRGTPTAGVAMAGQGARLSRQAERDFVVSGHSSRVG